MTNKIKIPNSYRKALLSKYCSRMNKLHLIAGWTYFNNWYIDWKWAGEPHKSRMLFKFWPDEDWVQAESFEEDLMPTYKFARDSKK